MITIHSAMREIAHTINDMFLSNKKRKKKKQTKKQGKVNFGAFQLNRKLLM